jgi:hypothetical protein
MRMRSAIHFRSGNVNYVMSSVEAIRRFDRDPYQESFAAIALRWSIRGLVVTAWISTALFGLYILAFYAAAAAGDDISRWNETLPKLYEAHTPAATAGIALHFAAGGIVLALGSIQFISSLRARYPSVHRWLGRVYVLAAFSTGVGGLTFILVKGTIGGTMMNIGFGLYGVLTVLAAVMAYLHARARRLELHRAWAMRLFALALGSWLYRMDYGFWFLLADGAGHQKNFGGPFDMVMDFFFYIPNLILVEWLLRSQSRPTSDATRLSLATTFVLATAFVLLGTYFFTREYWGPAIIAPFVS